ncbi:MAG TPA: Hsp70 family protein [Chloroflexia bacterium]|nr:Hsp70 family protein [Chloroflexia bacterium]
MDKTTPFIGIDFGTSKCTVAWLNPETGRAEILRNAEGGEITPSVVYFGEHETLVGEPAEQMLENEEERGRVIMSIKRDMVIQPTLALPGGRRVKATEVAAEIFRKLKHDAEELYFQVPVTRAVVTVPAAFDALQMERIEVAAKMAGFNDVQLVEEPVAAAIAYARAGLNVGQRVLVYDLGAGTFDLAVLARDAIAEDQGRPNSFRLVMESRGVSRLGGDDFDRALYEYCDEVAIREMGRGIATDGKLDLQFLVLCRRRKENLSLQERATFSTLLMGTNGSGSVRFQQTIPRDAFEGLIEDMVATTARLTQRVVEEAEARGHTVDTVVMVGGSSRVPMVSRMLKGALPVEPKSWGQRDVAVALGAAYYGEQVWSPKAATTPTSTPKYDTGRIRKNGGGKGTATAAPKAPPPGATPRDRYLRAVKQVWARGHLSAEDVEQLAQWVEELGLDEDTAAGIELDIMGDIKERMLHRQYDADREQYRRAVQAAWAKKRLTRSQVEELDDLAHELKINPTHVASIEREVMGDTKTGISKRSRPQLRVADLTARVEALGDSFITNATENADKLMKSDIKWAEKLPDSLKASVAGYGVAVQGEVQSEMREIGVDLSAPPFKPEVDVSLEGAKKRSVFNLAAIGIVSIMVALVVVGLGYLGGSTYSNSSLTIGEWWIAAVGAAVASSTIFRLLRKRLGKSSRGITFKNWVPLVSATVVALIIGAIITALLASPYYYYYSSYSDYSYYETNQFVIWIVGLVTLPFVFGELLRRVPIIAAKAPAKQSVVTTARNALPELKTQAAAYIREVDEMLAKHDT